HVLDDLPAFPPDVEGGLLHEVVELLGQVAHKTPRGSLIEHGEHPDRTQASLSGFPLAVLIIDEDSVRTLLAGEGDRGLFARSPDALPTERRDILDVVRFLDLEPWRWRGRPKTDGLGHVGMAHLRDDGGGSEHPGEDPRQDVLGPDEHEVMERPHVADD